VADYNNILVALDFSSSAELVAQRAKEIAERNRAELTLLHVCEYMPPIDLAYEPVVMPEWDIKDEALLEQAEAQLKRLADKLRLGDARRQVVLGIAKADIVSIAREQQVDLIVLGSHGRHGISRLLGSTANNVLHNAPCDVLAVRISE